MKKLFILSLCALFVFSGCTKEEEKDIQGCDDDVTCPVGNSADMTAYEGFNDPDNHYIQITMQDAIKKLETDASGIFLFSFPTCPWCIEAVPILNEAAKATNQYIYYIDKKAQTSDEVSILKMEDLLKDILEKKDGKPTLYVPEVIVVKDGEVVANHNSTVKDHNAHERKMTTDEQTELLNIYKDLIGKLN